MTLKIPLNRFVTFIKPYLNVAGGALAAWLVAKANILGIPGLGDHQNEIATGIAAGGIALVTWGAAQLGDMKWLKGHHIEVAAAAEGMAAGGADTHAAGEEGAMDHTTEDVAHSDLPGDREEFAAPPPDMPVQPSQVDLLGG